MEYCEKFYLFRPPLPPLCALLQKTAKWMWGVAQDEAFQQAKGQLTLPGFLVHYDPRKELLLSCDASPYGVGAVLSHRMDDGSERPVAYASRSLAPAERKYAQLEKEGLAIVFERKFQVGGPVFVCNFSSGLQALLSWSVDTLITSVCEPPPVHNLGQ